MAEPQRSSISALREQRRAALKLAKPDTRTAIIEATARQLETTSLHELSVSRIIEDAGVSRGSFYSYFESKQEVAGALLERTLDEIYGVWQPYVERKEDADSIDALREALARSIALWREHRGIGQAMHQYWLSVPELGDQWLAAVERFTAGIAKGIERDRAAGLAPPGAPSRQLAAAALWTTEQLQFVTATGESADLDSDEAVFEMLVSIWTGLIYGPA